MKVRFRPNLNKNFETHAVQLVFCVNCKEKPPSMHGWLCKMCWKDPIIRAAHKKKLGKASKIGLKFPTKLPDSPCQSQPGTIQKFEELCRRAEAGVHLWHPDDKKGE